MSWIKVIVIWLIWVNCSLMAMEQKSRSSEFFRLKTDSRTGKEKIVLCINDFKNSEMRLLNEKISDLKKENQRLDEKVSFLQLQIAASKITQEQTKSDDLIPIKQAKKVEYVPVVELEMPQEVRGWEVRTFKLDDNGDFLVGVFAQKSNSKDSKLEEFAWQSFVFTTKNRIAENQKNELKLEH